MKLWKIFLIAYSDREYLNDIYDLNKKHMERLYKVMEGMFDIEKDMDEEIVRLHWQKKFNDNKGDELRKVLKDYLKEFGAKKEGKKFKKKGIELGIFADDGFCVINWKTNEVFTLYEFRDTEFYSYGTADNLDIDEYHFEVVYLIDKNIFDFLQEVIFDED